MNSSSILDSFLLNRSSLDEIISLEKFSKLFPRATESATIEAIYDNLMQQRQANLRAIKSSIEKEYNIPFNIKDLDVELSDSFLAKFTLESLITRLKSLIKVLEYQLDEYDNDNIIESERLRQLVDQLGDLRYGRLTFQDSIREALFSLKKFERVLLRED